MYKRIQAPKQKLNNQDQIQSAIRGSLVWDAYFPLKLKVKNKKKTVRQIWVFQLTDGQRFCLLGRVTTIGPIFPIWAEQQKIKTDRNSPKYVEVFSQFSNA